MRGWPLGVMLTLAVLVLTACGGGQSKNQAAPTTVEQKSFADVVSAVRSGVIRIEADTCGGTGIGTGFLVGPRLVATVEHVVDGATSVKLKRGKTTLGTATVIGEDRDRDLALLRSDHVLSGHQFQLLSESPRLGQEVAAIGFPLGLPLSVSRGSVSGLKRSIPIEGITRRRLVQTDAAVNPGNSGGPLLTSDTGQVVGLVDLGTNEANGIAFAVSAQVAQPLLTAWKAAPQPVAASQCDYGYSPPAEAAPEPAPTTDASTYDGDYFAIDYPRSWQVETAEANKGAYLDTTIRDPSDSTTMLRVDVTPGSTDDLATAAGKVRSALSRASGYQELDFSPIDFQGYDAIRWEFLVNEDGVPLHKEDVFFMSGADEFAVLTQSRASAYSDLSDLFDSIRGSLYPYSSGD